MDNKIAQLGEEILRGPTREVKDVQDPEVQKVIKDLLEAVVSAKGVGIAGNQLRSDLRIFVMASHPSDRYPDAPEMEPTALINPLILSHSEDKEKDWEGCLSVATTGQEGVPTVLRGLVPRYTWVEAEYTTVNGERKKEKFEGFLARIFQHEIDHLDGLVYLDRVESNKDLYSQQVFEKMIKDKAQK